MLAQGQEPGVNIYMINLDANKEMKSCLTIK